MMMNPREPHDTIVLQYFTVSEEHIIMQQFHKITPHPSVTKEKEKKQNKNKAQTRKVVFSITKHHLLNS